jgi:16S rRNA (cytosine967-C5)-methyltransferase
MRQHQSPSPSQSPSQSKDSPHRVATTDAVRDGRVRRRVLDSYTRAAADWAAAPAALSQSFRGARELLSHERRFVAEAVYGMVRQKRRLEFALGLSDPAPILRYLAWLHGEYGAEPSLVAELTKAEIDVGRLEAVAEALGAIEDPIERLALSESYPSWLVARLVEERGLADSTALLIAMNQRAPLSARANRLRNTREVLAEALAEEGVKTSPSELCADGLTLETQVNAYGLGAFREGRFELQDFGSQLVGEVCAPPPRGAVLDACAGAGGKSLHLGALMGNRGRVVALDVSQAKLEELRRRARRAGLTSVRALHVSAEGPLELPRAVAGPYARVLVDAPCSGIGVLRRHPEARWRLSPADLDSLQRTQRTILDRVAPLVESGGRMIYATCTVLRSENDAVIDGYLSDHPSFEPVPLKEVLGSARAALVGDGERLRVFPHTHDCDGFFAAIVRRRRG